MNVEDAQRERKAMEIFGRATEIAGVEERARYLQGACGGDAVIRARVEALLKNHVQDDFLQKAAANLGCAEMTHVPAAEAVSTVIGQYKLLERLGEGGFGSVWLAEQKEPVRRKVALKVIKPGMDTRQVVARFEAERQVLALMDHPNIARVLDAGTTESGRPYFVMELVRGIPITKFCDDNKLPTRDRQELFIRICHAVQHAHQKGIIHRDLKPSNVLVTLHDGVPVPKVIDFGIAKATQQELTDKTLHTMFQQFIGTPAYVSPEQAEMSGLDIDTRSDIYSLGVLLYELLTGMTPFDSRELLASGLDQMRQTIREKEPPRPSTRLKTLPDAQRTTTARQRATEPAKLAGLLRGDLDWIVMKCLEKDRTRRYETATGLARDIERHLANEPVTACPPSTAYRLQKFVTRNRLMVGAIAAVTMTLVIGLFTSLRQAHRALRAERQAIKSQQDEADQRGRADAARAIAEQARQEALHNLYIANLNLVQADFDQGNIGRLRGLLQEAGRDPERGFEWYFWQRELHRAEKTFRGHSGALRGVSISPDSRYVLTAGLDGSARLWDVASGRELRRFSFQQPRMGAFSPDGERLAVVGDMRVVLWDLARDREVINFTNTSSNLIWAAAFSPDGRRLALGLFLSESSLIIDPETGHPLLELKDPARRVKGAAMSISFSPDGRRVLAGDGDGSARIWDAESGALLRRFNGQGGRIWAAEFSPDGGRIVTAHDYANVAKVWDASTGVVIHTLRGHKSWVFCAGFSPRGDRIYTAGLDQQIKVWDAVTGLELAPLPKNPSPGVFRMAIARDGRHVLTGSENGEASWWSVERMAGPQVLSFILWHEDEPSFQSAFTGVAHGPLAFHAPDSDRGLVLAAAPDFSAKVFELSSGSERCVLRGHTDRIARLSASPDLAFVATTSVDSSARIWDARDGRELVVFHSQSRVGPTVAFSPDSRRVIVTSNSVASVWHLGSRQLLQTFDFGTNAGVKAWSPDGNWIAGNVGDRLTLWSAQSGRMGPELENPRGVLAVAWAPDSQSVAAGIWPALTRIWDVRTGRVLRELRGHRVYSYTLAFSPDGKRLLTGAQDNTAKLWDVATGRELLTLAGHSDGVISASFSSNGRRIYTGSDDQTLRIWEAASPEEVAQWDEEEQEADLRLAAERKQREGLEP